MLFKPKGISFDLYTDEELLNICTVEITENVSLDNLGHPIKNGLHDERMGPLSQGSFCHSCKQGYFSCPGHFGYIKTDEYIKPLTVDLVMNVLMIKCLNCKNYKIRSQKKDEKKSKKKSKEEETESDFNEKEKLSELEEFAEKEKLSEEEDLSEEYQSDKNVESLTIYELIKETEKFNLSAVKRLRKLIGIKKCMHCLTQTRSIHKINNELFIKEEKLLVEKIKEILGKKFDKCFSKIVLVTPNKFRPLNFMGNKVYEDSKNGLYSKILKEKNVSLISQIDLCIKSLIEKKEGIFRQNVLGKRVNFSARSVISPDPNLETGEIGLPLIFAKKLSFPERVNEFNFNRLFLAVINGNKYPGATHLSCDDTKIDLSFLDENRRKSLAYQLKLGNKVVHRHVSDKDYLLVNRQPSLHKPSLMAHKVKVLQGEKTIRMHYANCNSYNADFDGDEMNLHLVQDYLAMSEAKNILSTDNNYKSDTNNKPIRGLVQDHIVGATLLTMKDSFFTQSEYFYLISSSEKKNKKIKSAILRPVILFTGKQVVSNLLINLNTKITFTLKSKVELEEVNFKNSHLLTGVLDKNTLGPSSFSLPDLVGKDHNLILSSFSKLINRYLIKYGFTLRINDLYLNDLGEKERLKEIKNSILQTEALYNLTNQNYTSFNLKKEDSLSQNGDLSEEKNKEPEKKNKLDDEKERVNYLNNNLYWNEEKYEEMSSLFKNTMNKFTTSILNTSMENTLIPFPYNNLSLIVLSGAKGSLVNISQICCLLGQQELEGKRVPLMKNNLTLQILSNNKEGSSIFESEVEKGGFIFDRFLTGIKIHSFFFHCMAGREGLIDTAVKTARSGYLQRCLVKHLEGLVVNYNGTVLNNSYSLISYQSKKESGTPVGLIAAQSIGEPSTQMTLNTFHLAGVGSKNVTLGIPRLREILMVNRTNKKYVVVKNTNFNSFFTKLKEILKKVEIQEYFEERKIVKVKLELKEKIVEEVCAILNEKFLLLLNKKIKKVIQERVSIEANIVKEEQNEEINEEEDVFNENSEKSESVSEESSLSFNDEELNEENNFREKRIKVEENKKLKGKIVNKLKLSSSDDCIFLECVVLNNSELILYPFIIDTLESIKLKESEVTNVIKDTKEGITTVEGCGLNYMTKFVLENIKYDKENDSEDFLVNNSNEEVLKEVEEIIKVMNPNPHQKKFKQIKVNNCFIDLIDKIFLTTYSNDIQSVNTVLGLEAGRTVLIKELKNVFDCYGISIDINHLNLIGDYMCRSGNIKAFNRNSFKDEDCLIQRMSFESTYSVLKNSLKKNIKINGPSSKQLIGGIIKEECEIIYDLNN